MEHLTTANIKDVAIHESPKPSKFDLLVQGLSEGFLLIYLTALSYICAYAFEFGFYSYFRLPVHFVSVELDDCLRAGFYISFAGLIAFSNANGFLRIATSIGVCESKARQILGFLIVMTGIGWVLDYFFAWGYPLWIILGILA